MKILILCKDFPPSNKIGGKRPFAWHNFLSKNGIESVVVTSTMSRKLDAERGIYRVDCNTEHLSKSVHLSKTKLFLRKFRSFFELWLPFILPHTSRYWSLYKQADELLKASKFDFILATADPFILFKFASKLSKKHNLLWIPDYRDNWSNEPTQDPDSLNALLFQRLYTSVEVSLLKSTKDVITVGTQTAERIRLLFSGNNIHIIENGHNIPDDFEPSAPPSNKIRITHIGRLYLHRNPDMFLKGVSNWQQNNPNTEIELRFLGIDDFPNQRQELQEKAKILSIKIETTPSIEYNEMLKLASASHAFLLLADPNLPLTNGKIYDYLGLHRPIILAPDDKSVFCKIIKEEKCGFAINNSDELIPVLDSFKNNLSNPAYFSTSVDSFKYSRENGTKQLAEILKKIKQSS